MNRNHLWKLLLILFVLAWAIYEITPPKARPLVDYFRERGVSQDETFRTIYQQAKEATDAHPQRAYGNLLNAIGTNDITRYFPFFDAKTEPRPTTYILNRLQREAAGKIKLGIDLAGGTSFLVEMDTNRLSSIEITTRTNSQGQVLTETNVVKNVDVHSALSQAVEVFRKRVDALGVAEPVIQPEGHNRIRIQLPGLSEEVIQDARNRIQKVAFLEFRLVHPQSRQLIEQGSGAPGYEVLSEVRTMENGTKTIEKHLVKRRAELVGGIQRADLSRDNLGRPEILFSLEPHAAEVFARVTRENIGRQLAIVLDGELQSAPNIKSEIPGGRGTITGDYTEQQARALVSVLENPLKAPVHIIDERSVDPSLGKDSIASGMTAALIAAGGTFLFMLIFYFTSGLVANLALGMNVLILIGALCAIDGTLTMPGIAGIALTIGMAVDANVLIYERMREETAAGKSIRGVIEAGYNKAFGTILDSNLTTAIAGIILINLGTGAIKGFGVTLTIGICVSMFTALFVTRLIYDFLLARGWITKVRMLPLVKFEKIPFMRWGTVACIVSAVLIIGGIGTGLVHGKKVLGVDFTGGEAITLSFTQRVGTDDLRGALDKAGLKDANIGYQRSLATGMETLQVVVPFGAGTKAQTVLKDTFPQAGLAVKGIDSIGASVGEEIQVTAVIASLVALFAILVYVAFRYEFSFALASVVALIHDVLITLGIFFMFGKQLSAPVVAAVLTIFGYSINDKIVIMDRIREDLKLGVRGSFRELIDIALNQTLSRTIITGGAVILSTLALLIFGGGEIHDFAFTFFVGILAGTYSSIFIASPIVLWWHKGERPKLGNLPMPTAGAPTPAPTGK